MPVYKRLIHNRVALVWSVAALAALGLLWLARDLPLQAWALARADALSAFFAFTTLAGLALAAWADRSRAPSRGAIVTAALLVVTYLATPTPAIMLGYLLLALLIDAPALLAAACLLTGYGALALRGALRYDERLAGAALDSFVFWFVLLAAAGACIAPLQWRHRELWEGIGRGERWKPILVLLQRPISTIGSSRPIARLVRFRTWLAGGATERAIFRIAWLYPLARLYTPGPWNSGWSFAALLLGGAVALWGATTPFTREEASERATRALPGGLGLALAGLGLGTSAGIAAACYALLAYVTLAVGTVDPATGRQSDEETERLVAQPAGRPLSLAPWLLTGAIPFTAPFVAIWMLAGAAAAAGVSLLAGIAWLVGLLNALAAALPRPARPAAVAAGASALLGICAPVVVRVAIEPVIEQTQGGLTPFGEINIWPWVGVAASDAAHTQVAALPTIAVAGLMLTLSALVYLVARLRGTPVADSSDKEVSGEAEADRLRALFGELRREVPWLGGRREEQRRDGE